MTNGERGVRPGRPTPTDREEPPGQPPPRAGRLHTAAATAAPLDNERPHDPAEVLDDVASEPGKTVPTSR
ncbi:hypothetical protein [Streptomyces sp. NPDC005336]|uniref:hypothetical protein n=1 Tax=Streptomyces sp. NPDC005336 TaxID=3157035 RepID=UPI0033AAC1DD